jgi:RNA polymerase sigma factor (sigma-70 family)
MTPAQSKAKVKKAKTQEPQSDTQLVAQCLKGKESAWEVLIEKYKNLIFSIPLRYGFPEEESADIFQSVCMDLLAELPCIKEPQALAAWLIQVTRNKCFHRKQALQRHEVQEIGDHDPPAPSDDADNLASQVQQDQLMREALADLPDQCRELVHMLFFETPPRPYDEVAKTLHLARGSVGFVRKNCLNKLRERLENLGY